VSNETIMIPNKYFRFTGETTDGIMSRTEGHVLLVLTNRYQSMFFIKTKRINTNITNTQSIFDKENVIFVHYILVLLSEVEYGVCYANIGPIISTFMSTFYSYFFSFLFHYKRLHIMRVTKNPN
jgi:hypothetical protein